MITDGEYFETGLKIKIADKIIDKTNKKTDIVDFPSKHIASLEDFV